MKRVQICSFNFPSFSEEGASNTLYDILYVLLHVSFSFSVWFCEEILVTRDTLKAVWPACFKSNFISAEPSDSGQKLETQDNAHFHFVTIQIPQESKAWILHSGSPLCYTLKYTSLAYFGMSHGFFPGSGEHAFLVDLSKCQSFCQSCILVILSHWRLQSRPLVLWCGTSFPLFISFIFPVPAWTHFMMAATGCLENMHMRPKRWSTRKRWHLKLNLVVLFLTSSFVFKCCG